MLDYEALKTDIRGELEQRLNEFRLLHSISVAETAVEMAKRYSTDPEHAYLAGLLHDWDKCLSDGELLERAEVFGIEPRYRMEDMAALLHAQTGALAVAQKYPELPCGIIQAINRHTSAATDMSDLDMIIYIADMIEPLRTQGSLTQLRKLVGHLELEELFVKAYELTLSHLISRHKFLHPDTLDVWNTYVNRERSHPDFKAKRAMAPGSKKGRSLEQQL